MTRYDVVVVGAGVAGSLVAHRLGRQGRRVLVLEAGPADRDPAADPLTAYLAAAAKVPGSPYRTHPAASWPEPTDPAGTGGAPGFRASGHLRQDGPLPYASGYVRVNGGTGNVWTGLAPRMLPEDFDTESFGYGRRWPLSYDELEPHYRDAEEELGVAADVDEQREQVGRNLMDHPVLLTWGLLPDATGPYRGPGSVSGFEGFRAGPARRRRAPFRVEFGTWGWIWAKGPVDTDVDHFLNERGLFGGDLRRAVGDRIRRQFTLQFEMEQSADPANRVGLHPHERDALGLPLPLVTYDLDEHVRQGMAAARAVSDQIFALLGAEDHTEYAPAAAWPGRFEHGGRPYGYRGGRPNRPLLPADGAAPLRRSPGRAADARPGTAGGLDHANRLPLLR
ncbi:NAD(P)-binding protein [Streptomyces vietnamensis]|uniref:NAD(P)-binding protein n=1 Tax=Streptomyces vietnamensis TaxID=362257 RepID=UPI0037A7BAA0